MIWRAFFCVFFFFGGGGGRVGVFNFVEGLFFRIFRVGLAPVRGHACRHSDPKPGLTLEGARLNNLATRLYE